jgi:hypothetical protein
MTFIDMITFPSFFSKKAKQIKNSFIDPLSKNQKVENFASSKVEPTSYIDLNLSVEEKIEFEKRRRHQVYMTLDYFLSVFSYFDFFSLDSFQIVKKAKTLTQFFQKKFVTSDFLLFPFFEVNSEISSLLEKYGIRQKDVDEALFNTYKIKQENVQLKSLNSFKNFFVHLNIPFISKTFITTKSTRYSYEVHSIFEKAAQNALKRFKTPVISSEILLITMLEAKKTKVGKLIKQLLKNDTNWYMLRYSLIKRLHSQELAIRTHVPKNHQYFAYLLKTELPESQFDTLLEKDCLLPGTLLFRNMMIDDLLKINFAEYIKKDILASIKSNTGRKYSV